MGMLGLWRKGTPPEERIVKERSFSKKELAVLTDPQFGGKDLALIVRRLRFLTF